MSLGLGHETGSGTGYSLVCAIVQNRIESSYGIDGDPNKEVTISQGVSYGPTKSKIRAFHTASTAMKSYCNTNFFLFVQIFLLPN